MLKIMYLLLIIVAVSTGYANEVRVSVLMVHYSVGAQIVRANCHISDRLSDLIVTRGSDTARIVFRSYVMNYEFPGIMAPLADTLDENCDIVRFTGFDYDIYQPAGRTQISNGGSTCGLLDNLFNVPNKEAQPFWRMFKEHNVPGVSGDSVVEKYDLILVKNPYAVWMGMTPERRDMYRGFYEAVRDSVSNNPDINLVLCFGTPLTHDSRYFVDSSQAKLVYELAEWFDSDQFFTHSNTGPYKNLWKWDSYTPLCETDLVAGRYCLRAEYFDGASSGSHLSEPLAAGILQDNLVVFLEGAVRDILIQKSGTVTRQDIDRMILEFRKGNATEAEVQELIQQYHDGGGQ